MMFEHFDGRNRGSVDQHLYCLYLFTLNDKQYVGQTNDTYTRFSGHRSSSSGCRYISNAIKTHGWENVKVKILLVDLTLNEANRLETHYIDTLRTLSPGGYNLTRGGDNRELSEDSKEALRIAWEDEGRKEALRERLKARWEVPGAKEAQGIRTKEMWEKEGHKEDHINMITGLMRELWETPGYREAHTRVMKELWETTEMREAHARGQQTRYSCQENREKHREAMSHLRRFTDEAFIRANNDFNGSVKKLMNMFNVGKTTVNEHKHRLGLITHYRRKVVA